MRTTTSELPPHPEPKWVMERIMAVCGDMANCEDCPLCTLPQTREGQECWERAVEVITFPALYEVRHGLVRPIFDRKREGMENYPRRPETGAQKAREGAQDGNLAREA